MMKCYIWNCFVIPVFFFFFDTAHVHISKKKKKMSDAKWNRSILEAKYKRELEVDGASPQPLTPSRQQHLMRHLIILK